MSRHGWTERALLSCGCDIDAAEHTEPRDEARCGLHGAQTVRKVVRLNWTSRADVFRRDREREAA